MRHRRGVALAAGLVGLVACVVYANTLINQFVNDDLQVVVANAAVRELEVGRIFTTPSWWGTSANGYRPLVTLSFALNYQFSRLWPGGYHFINVLLHALVCILVLLVVVRLSRSVGAALAVALLFAVHPLNTEAVATLAGRAELMAALFVLLAVWVDLGTYEQPQAGRRWLRYGVEVVAYAAGLLCEGNAVTLLPVLLATDWLVRSHRRWAEFAAGLRGARGALYGGLVAVLVGYGAWRLHVEGGVLPAVSSGMNPLLGVPAGERLINAVVIAGRYLWLLVFPARLSADYMVGALPVLHSVWDWRVLTSAGALASLVALGVVSARRFPLITWGLAFAACTYSVVSNVALPAQAMMAERWMYLPGVGLCVAAVFLGAALLSGVPARGRSAVAAAVVAVLVFVGAVRTVRRNRDWHDNESLWQATLHVVPGSFKAREGLADAELERRHYGETVRLLEEALRIHDGDPRTYARLALAYERLGKLKDAERTYKAGLAKLPDSLVLLRGIGRVHLAQGNYFDAVHEFHRAVQLEPKSARLHTQLGKAYLLQLSTDAADEEFVNALKLDPRQVDALIGRAACAQRAAEYTMSLEYYLKALEIGAPRTYRLRRSIEQALIDFSRRDPAKARAYAQRVLRYYPEASAIRELAKGGKS